MAGWKPYAAMVIVEAMYSSNAILTKVAFNRGMNTFVFVFYRQVIATLLFIPFAITTTRKTVSPPLPPILLFKTFMFTLFGVESIRFKSSSGIAKVFGLALCICGVMVIAFYKGPELRSLDHYHLISNHHYIADSNGTWMVGSILMVTCSVLWSAWNVSQATIIKDYPSSLIFVTFYCFFSAIQSFLVAMVAETQVSKWKLHWDQGLLAIPFSGICVAGIAAYLQTWSNGKKGPVFVGMFGPLSLVITITISSVLLGEVINLGSVLGGALLVGGLYSVLWGKKSELQEKGLHADEGSVPFLIGSSSAVEQL